MPDQPDDLTPAEREVRRLLAEARHDEPVPAEVVARLDRVLADLAEEPAREAPVLRLAARRRRAASLLVAAAAVVAVGIGLGQVLDRTPEGGDASSAAEGQADDAGGADLEDGAVGGSTESGEPTDSTLSQPEAQADQPPVATLDSTDLADGITKLRSLGGNRARGELRSTGEDRAQATATACGAQAWGRGAFVPVRYDDQPAVLVFRRPVGDTQVVDLFVCGATEPVRSVSLPSP